MALPTTNFGLGTGNSVPTTNFGTVDFNKMLNQSLYQGMPAFVQPSSNGISVTSGVGNNTSTFNPIGGTPPTPDFFSTDTLNNVATGIGALSNLANIYTGFKGLGLAEDSFNFNRDLTNTNLANQANLTNEMLATRQATRLRSQGITGEANDAAVADFMSKYGVSGKVGG